jgi:hypothetical protein
MRDIISLTFATGRLRNVATIAASTLRVRLQILKPMLTAILL